MKMRSPAIIRWVLIAVAFCCVAGQFFGQTPSEPGVQTLQSAPKRQGFLDYALGKVNPHGIGLWRDDGVRTERCRRIHH